MIGLFVQRTFILSYTSNYQKYLEKRIQKENDQFNGASRRHVRNFSQ